MCNVFVLLAGNEGNFEYIMWNSMISVRLQMIYECFLIRCLHVCIINYCISHISIRIFFLVHKYLGNMQNIVPSIQPSVLQHPRKHGKQTRGLECVALFRPSCHSAAAAILSLAYIAGSCYEISARRKPQPD